MIWLVVAYSLFSIAILAYTLTMGRKQDELDRRIADLKARIERDPPRS